MSFLQLRVPVIGVAISAVTACSISQDVRPVKSDKITTVCLEQNKAVKMAAFEPTLRRLIEERGVATSVFSSSRPASCRYLAKYTANWRWDGAMYLYYARIEVMDGDRTIGSAEYDARSGTLSLRKYGTTEGKLRPMVAKLFPKK